METTSEHYGHAVRSVHAKSHGILKAELTVLPDLPPEFAQGMFAVPGVYQAVLRISTNPGDILSDSISVPRGLALKVMEVGGARLSGAEGNSQDFVMVNGPVFTAPNAKAFLKSLKLLAKTTDRAEWAKKALSAVLRGAERALEAVGGGSATLHIDSVQDTFLGLGYPPSVSVILARLCCKDDRLPQGAPTSPAISNLICRNLDKEISDLAKERFLTYTRYADDISVSGDDLGSDVLEKIEFILNSFGFFVNEEKTRISKNGDKKIVTGISIGTGLPKLPRKEVRSIKADAHALLSYGLLSYLERSKKPDPLVVERLTGRVAFWLQVEPENPTAIKLKSNLQTLSDQIDRGIFRL